MFVRGRYGQGGRLGYEKEWRADPKLSGGGELIDQGVHLIDLAGSFSR
jgi:predicted dehydrogenase